MSRGKHFVVWQTREEGGTDTPNVRLTKKVGDYWSWEKRQDKKRGGHEKTELPSANPDVLHGSDERELTPKETAMRQLIDDQSFRLELFTPREERCFWFSFVKEHNQEETARRMGVSQAAVSKIQQRIRGKFVKYFTKL